MALGYKGKMTDLERRRHDEMVASHHGELLKKGASPTQTDVHSRTSIGSHTKEHGRLWTTDNGKEIHHQWYNDEGTPTHAPAPGSRKPGTPGKRVNIDDVPFSERPWNKRRMA